MQKILILIPADRRSDLGSQSKQDQYGGGEQPSPQSAVVDGTASPNGRCSNSACTHWSTVMSPVCNGERRESAPLSRSVDVAVAASRVGAAKLRAKNRGCPHPGPRIHVVTLGTLPVTSRCADSPAAPRRYPGRHRAGRYGVG